MLRTNTQSKFGQNEVSHYHGEARRCLVERRWLDSERKRLKQGERETLIKTEEKNLKHSYHWLQVRELV